MTLLDINFAASRAITTMTTCSILTTARLKQRSAIIRYISEIFRNISTNSQAIVCNWVIAGGRGNLPEHHFGEAEV